MDRWEHMARNPNESAVFNAAMTNNTELEASAIASRYDFSQFGVVADVGGGDGSLLATILTTNPSLQGILFDLPHVVAAASGTLERAGVTDRCKTVGGSFFDAVPAGADVYVMKRVIHDWDDEQAIAILRSCRSVMVNGAKLLLIEQIIRPGNTPDPAKFTDLMMLVMQGGKERTTAPPLGPPWAGVQNDREGPLCLLRSEADVVVLLFQRADLALDEVVDPAQELDQVRRQFEVHAIPSHIAASTRAIPP